MKLYKSKPGVLIAAGYLLLAFVSVSPLVWDGFIGHGNGLFLILATALTLPLSLLLFFLVDLVSDVNYFYMIGWPYVIRLCALIAGALFNAKLIYLFVAFLQRKPSR